MTRNAALTVRLPGARIAPAKSTWTCGHKRLENSGTNGFSKCSIVVGRVRSSPLCGGLAMIVPYLFFPSPNGQSRALSTWVNKTRRRQGRLGTSGAGFLRVLDRMLVVDHLEGLLVDLFGG